MQELPGLKSAPAVVTCDKVVLVRSGQQTLGNLPDLGGSAWLVKTDCYVAEAQVGRMTRWTARFRVQPKLPAAWTKTDELLQSLIEAAGSGRQFDSLLLCCWGFC